MSVLSKRESKARPLLRVHKADEAIIKSEGSIKADSESLSYEQRAEIHICSVFFTKAIKTKFYRT